MSFFGSRRHVEEPVPPTPEPVAPPTPLPVQQPIGFDTVIGANAIFEGNFTSSSNVRIDGTVTGSININGNVLVGETAKINADLYAKNISVAGAVRGNVHGKKVQLLRTGRVWGDINATALTTEEGAFIDGKISMVSPDAPRKADQNMLVDEPSFLAEPSFVQDGSLDNLENVDDSLNTQDEITEAGDLDGGIMTETDTYFEDELAEDEFDAGDSLDDDLEEETFVDTTTPDNAQWEDENWNQDNRF